MALNWCCFCVPLRAGALTLAILYLVVNIGVLLGWAVWFIVEFAWYMEILENVPDYQKKPYKSTGLILLILCVVCGLNITIDSLLVHGIRRNRRKFMLPWLVWYGIVKTLATLALLGFLTWLLVLYIQANPRDGYGVVDAYLLAFGGGAAITLPVMWCWYASVVAYYALLAPSDVYVMESLHEQQDTGVALLSHRPVERDAV